MKNRSEFVRNNIYGGFSSFDLALGNTRKYHGLLVVSDDEFVRYMVLASLNETVKVGEESYNFSNNSYEGHKQALGTPYLRQSYLLPYPTQIYRIQDATIKKQIITSEDDYAVQI